MDNKKKKTEETVVFRKGDFSAYGLEIGLWDALCEIGDLYRDGEDEVWVIVSKPAKRVEG